MRLMKVLSRMMHGRASKRSLFEVTNRTSSLACSKLEEFCNTHSRPYRWAARERFVATKMTAMLQKHQIGLGTLQLVYNLETLLHWARNYDTPYLCTRTGLLDRDYCEFSRTLWNWYAAVMEENLGNVFTEVKFQTFKKVKSLATVPNSILVRKRKTLLVDSSSQFHCTSICTDTLQKGSLCFSLTVSLSHTHSDTQSLNDSITHWLTHLLIPSISH